MKNFCTQNVSTTFLIEQSSKNKDQQGKLYVAHRNDAMIECYAMESNSGSDYENNTRNYKASVFSTTGGSYYIDGVPALLSQDDEAMLYEGELAEYY
jgi:hypothetical protein